MPSFLDELKSKKNAVIREEHADNSFYDRILIHRDEILDKLFKCQIQNTIEEIKERLTEKWKKDPKASYVSATFLCDEYRFGWCNLDNLVEAFNSYGCDFHHSFNNHSEELFTTLLKKMGLCSPDARDIVHYDSDDRIYSCYISAVKLFEKKGVFLLNEVRKMTDEGKVFMEELKKAANLEGISIEYKTTVSFNYNPVTDAQRIKCKKDKIFLTASIRI